MDTTKNGKSKKSTEKDVRDGNLFLKKHVGLIHCENRLTLVQRKICNILLFNALDNIQDQDIHEIALRKLCSLVGYNSNDTRLIKESIKHLISIVMEWNLLEDNKFLSSIEYPDEAIIWNASSLLAGASIKQGVVRYSYSPQMKSILSSLDIYGRINLFVQAKFNSTYSLVLYENCVRFKNISQTSWFPIDLFRSLMGVSDQKYRPFKEFKRNVITVAVNEINQKSDIYIEPQYKKSGRHIAAVQFLLSDNENYQPTFKKINRLDNMVEIQQQHAVLLNSLIHDFHLSKKQASEIMMDYNHDYIKEKISLVSLKKNVQHSGAYLISALKKDYKKVQQKIPVSPVRSCQREAKDASEIPPLRNKYMSYKLNAYTQFVRQQTDDMRGLIHHQFEIFLQPKGEVFKFYKKKGLGSPFVMSEFMHFIENNFPQVIGPYLTFEDYITSEDNQ